MEVAAGPLSAAERMRLYRQRKRQAQCNIPKTPAKRQKTYREVNKTKIANDKKQYRKLHKTQVAEQNRKKLANPTYIHAVSVIKLTGFKITKNGISLDLMLDFLGYSPMENDKPNLNASTSMYFNTSFSNQSKRPRLESNDDTSDDSDNENKETAKDIANW